MEHHTDQTPDTAIIPRAHQIEALDRLRSTLNQHTRVQAHMCCGSGKTFTQAFLAQYIIESNETPSQVLIACFVPNRTLIYQNARNFKKVFHDTTDMMGICSDFDPEGLVADSDITTLLNTSTDPEIIHAFLKKGNKPKILFCTYQSMVTLRTCIETLYHTTYPLSLGLFDEAHRTAGNKSLDDLFAFGLQNTNFPMQQRAFFTATPRIVESKKTDIISMSDQALYGPIAYEYPFSQGIEDGNVVDYDLWVPIITRKELVDYMQDKELESEERMALGLIALEKVMEKTGQTRFLTYHSRIAGSQAFAKLLQQAMKNTNTTIAHVDGTTPGSIRDKMMNALNSGRTIITNCKAFVEGVDAPGVQGALFVDPRKSVVDVVQAVGRLSRPDPNDPNKRGSIIAPILAENATPEAIYAAATNGGFKTLIQVAQALRANDDALAEDILDKSRSIGRNEAITTPLKNMEILVSDSEDIDLNALANAITVATLNELQDPFAIQVGKLEYHLNLHGHLPTTQTDPKLYQWMTSMRKKHAQNTLEPTHAQLLDNLEDWSWVGERSTADTIANHIQAFKNRTHQMPSSKRGKPAEADLHSYLMEAQEEFLRKNVKNASKLTQTLYERNLLFFAEEVLGKRAQVAGHFTFPKDKEGNLMVIFHPRTDKGRVSIPFFRSGHTIPPRPIRIHAGRTERERLQALSTKHSVRLTLTRAGINQDPYKDGQILEWHAGTVDRGETENTSPNSLLWLISRLMDRKVSGRPGYTTQNVNSKIIKPNKPATRLNTKTPEGTIQDVLDRLEKIRKAYIQGKLSNDQIMVLDTCPGFSWIEETTTKEDLEIAIPLLLQRITNETILHYNTHPMDTGLHNSIKTLENLKDMTILSEKITEKLIALFHH